MKSSVVGVVLSCIVCSLQSGCLQERSETPTKGTAHIVVSETIEPIAQQEKATFEELYTEARLSMQTMPTRSALVEFFNVDTIKSVLSSRPLNREEIQTASNTGLKYAEFKLAIDAVAVIVNPDNPVTQLRTTQLDSVYRGLVTSWNRLMPVAPSQRIDVILPDENSGEFEIVGTKVLRGKRFEVAARVCSTSLEMIRTVASAPGALGMVGLSWLKGMEDSVRIVELSDPAAPESLGISGRYFAPHQAYLYKGYYPLTSEVYLYSRADAYSVASGFTSFVTSAPGQKIFLNNGLVPATMPVRIVQLTNKELAP